MGPHHWGTSKTGAYEETEDGKLIPQTNENDKEKTFAKRLEWSGNQKRV